MIRRTFIKACVAGIAAIVLRPTAQAISPAAPVARGMKHLFWNDEGETVAADTVEQAARYHDAELSGDKIVKEEYRDGQFYVSTERWQHHCGWSQIPDDKPFPIANQDDGGKLTKLAREWASECDEPTQVATTYW